MMGKQSECVDLVAILAVNGRQDRKRNLGGAQDGDARQGSSKRPASANLVVGFFGRAVEADRDVSQELTSRRPGQKTRQERGNAETVRQEMILEPMADDRVDHLEEAWVQHRLAT